MERPREQHQLRNRFNGAGLDEEREVAVVLLVEVLELEPESEEAEVDSRLWDAELSL